VTIPFCQNSYESRSAKLRDWGVWNFCMNISFNTFQFKLPSSTNDVDARADGYHASAGVE
jgi:hypothetical protein